ncbi:uncharacterized protein [Magallana gigas]|uniref:uncharacterized protein isoform X1 n=1 Tax=Magallana gigas TaxID=29159 RepID=UPI0033407CA7
MSYFGWLTLFVLWYYVDRVFSFPVNDIQMESNTMSHSAITLEAVYKTTATFLDRMQLVSDTEQSPEIKVKNYFGTDQESQQQFTNIIQELSGYEGNVRRDHGYESFYHVSGEQIQMAHFFIRSLRSKVKDLSSNTAIVKSNISLIREQVATLMYVIQEFYSNTNWIELHGLTIYEDFGQDGITLVGIADFKDKTCINCKYVNGIEHCENNTIGTKLTSGYRSGQNVGKPKGGPNDIISGKCSHGTPDDTSRNIIATGGIYKGRSNRKEAPHSYLHSAAAKAAVKATEYYLIDQNRGLLELIGPEVFRDIFGIRSREEIVKTSLTFVIDVTGSMGDDIENVRIATKKIVNEAKDSQFVPEKYILVTFSDPASLTMGRNTTDFKTMLTWLDDIRVAGGDDCPEYAMSGILKGIEMSNNNSKIYFITDADAKDAHLENEVTNGLKAKNLELIMILTGKCPGRRKRDGTGKNYGSTIFQHEVGLLFHRVKRSSINVFESIAAETGGKVYVTSTSEVEAIVEKEIKETFPSSNVFVTLFVMPRNSTHNSTISIPVDDYINTLKIMVEPVTSLDKFVFYYPNGTVVSFSSPNEERELLGNILRISVRNPEPGQWTLRKMETSAWNINVTAHSALDFSTSVLETSSVGNSYQLSGNPIKGNNYSVVVDIQNLNPNSTCLSVVLMDDSGNEITEIFVTRVQLMGIARYIGDFVPYNKSSYVQIRGEDDQGNPFLRTRSLSIIPVSVQLRISPHLGDLRLNETSNISFSLTNTGESLIVFVITISDGNTDLKIQQDSLYGGDVYSDVVEVIPNSLQTITLHFSVTLENYTGIIQAEKRRYSVMDTRTADCTVTEHPQMCPTESRNTENCTSYNWTGSVEVSSATIRDSLIRVSTDEVILDHINLTESNFSVPILIRGHCCIQNVMITIIDKDGFFDQCNLVVSEHPLTVVQYPTTTERQTTFEETTFAEETTTVIETTAAEETTTVIETTAAEETTPVAETTTLEQVTVYVTSIEKRTLTGLDKEAITDEGNSKVIGMSVGFSVLGLTLVALIIFAVYTMKSRSNNIIPVVLSNYRTLKREDDINMGVNEILSKYHDIHNGEQVTQEFEVADCQGSETKEKIDVVNTITTDCTKEESKTNDNQARTADSSDHKAEKDTGRDDEKLTSNKSLNETIIEAKSVSESLAQEHTGIPKQDAIQGSVSSIGQKESSNTNLNVCSDFSILNSGEEHDMKNQKSPPENGSSSNNISVRTSQVLQNKEGTEVISEERSREETD